MSRNKGKDSGARAGNGTPTSDVAEAPEMLSITSVDQLKAIAHPLRQQLFEAFATAPATTKQVAETLGLQPTRLYHHVAKLADAGLIELTKTRQVRGTTEKYYRAVATLLRVDRTAFGSEQAELIGTLAGTGVLDSLLNNVRNEVQQSLELQDCMDEIVFAQVGMVLDADTAEVLREKIAALVKEAETLGKQNESGDSTREYRMLVGWYPRAG